MNYSLLRNTVPFNVSILALCCGLSPVLLAQQGQQSVPELIEVVAKKRVQALRQIDISMDVFSDEDLRDLKINTLPELADFSENVALFEDMPGAGIPTWVIRGVGLQDFNNNNSPAASIFVDGAYQVSTAMGSAALFDTEQVEILKGPQGGLYGRNTSGGAVLLNTHRAVLDEQSAYVELGYGRWDRAVISGAANLPVTDTLAMRVAAKMENSSDGWQQSITDGREHGEKDRWDIRTWLHFEPSASFQADLKLQAGQDDSDIALGRAVGVWTLADTGPAFCDAILSGQRNDNCLSWAGLSRTLLTGNAEENVSDQAVDGSLVLSDPFNRLGNEYAGAVLEMQWELDNYRLLSLTTLDHFDYQVFLDLDATRGELSHRLSSSDIEVFSQEFRLQNAVHSDFSWMAGVSYSDEKFTENRDFIIRANTLVRFATGLGEFARSEYQQDTRSFAVFGDAEYQLNERWSVNGSLRYTDEDKDYYDGSFYEPLTPGLYYVKDIGDNYSLDSHFSGSLALNWRPDDATLIYLKYSRGFKSGGFYGGFPFSKEEIAPYSEEKIDAYELGFRAELDAYNLSVNGALFSYDYHDVQGFIRKSNPLTGTDIDLLGNQGDASHLGAEASLHWAPGTRFTADLGLGWLDAEYDKSGIYTVGVNGQLVEIQGDRPWAPTLNSNLRLAYHQQDFSPSAQMSIVLGWNYRSEFSGHAYSLADEAINKLPGYALMNAATVFTGKQGGWEASLWARNLLGKEYKTRVKADGLNSYMDTFGEPRSFGVTMRVSF